MERSLARRRLSRRALLGGAGAGTLGLIALSAGCGRAADSPAPAARSAPAAAPSASEPTAATDTPYFPPPTGDAWESLNATDNGWDDQGLADLATYCGDHNSSSLMLTQGGRIVLEQYWKGASRHTTTDVASAQKSVVSFLIGATAADGLLAPDDQVSKYLGAGWTKSPSTDSKITIRHLLTMTSGLTNQFAFEAQPGARWQYNTNAFQMLARVIERATNTTIDDWTERKLGQPIGWQDAAFNPRENMLLPDGTPTLGLKLSARDAARFGLLALRNGKWAGEQVVPASFVAEALSPSNTLNPSYGLLWWLNGKQSYIVPGPPVSRTGSLVPAAPPDLVAAMGSRDQRIYVVPSRQWVVVRQGLQANPGEAGAEALSGFDAQFFTRLMAAAPT